MIGLNKVSEGQLAIIVAIIGFITGAVQLFIRFVLNKPEREINENKDDREEEAATQKRIDDLWSRIDILQKEVEIWRLKYYAEHQQLIILESKIKALEDQISSLKEKLSK